MAIDVDICQEMCLNRTKCARGGGGGYDEPFYPFVRERL
jgi:hypothetical protein